MELHLATHKNHVVVVVHAAATDFHNCLYHQMVEHL
jgi:hypothetical protein